MKNASIRRVAILGNHVPRRCGIATFTADLAKALATNLPAADVDVYAVNDGRHYQYPAVVKGTLAEQDLAAYRQLGDRLNSGSYDLLCVQHEFGIYGGESGSHLLSLLSMVNMPIVSTLHTVLTSPSAFQRQVFEELTQLSSKVITMSNNGAEILRRVYRVPEDLIVVVPHGIHRANSGVGRSLRESHNLFEKSLILTFGLLSRDKGIDFMIEAMPAILAEHPDAIYLVAGATHPKIKMREGETYRRWLKARASELGIADSVRFLDRYLSNRELAGWLAAADVYVTPYLKPEQVVSGTLAYALGGVGAVVSTPYWYAEELLADDRGILVPFRDSGALAVAINGLLGDTDRREEIARRAFLYAEPMKWQRVGAAYAKVFESARSESSSPLKLVYEHHDLEVPSRWQGPSIEHLVSLTDETGITQHALCRFPNRKEGYCSDDNARALTLCLHLAGRNADDRIENLISTYFAFLMHSLNQGNCRFRNFLSYAKVWEESCSGDCFGRILEALATAFVSADDDLATLAGEYFRLTLPNILDEPDPRPWAHAILACETYLRRDSDKLTTELMRILSNRLTQRYESNTGTHWKWFEGQLTYENALLPRALIVAGDHFANDEAIEIGIESLSWLCCVQTSETGCFAPIGSDGFYSRGGKKARFDQQPLEAAATVSACLATARVASRAHWEEEARRAYRWFLGSNTEGLSLVDELKGKCFDGLQPGSVNRNCGAESTIAYLTASAELASIRAVIDRVRLA